jgi:hypothetical protein
MATESTPDRDHAPTPPLGPSAIPNPAPPHGGAQPCCSACASKAGEAMAGERFVFAIGKVDLRFPNLGLEREYQRAEHQLGKAGGRRGERLAAVLRGQRHIATRVCPLLMVGGVPAYVLAPAAAYVREALLEAVAVSDRPTQWVVAVGRLGPLCGPTDCGGVVAPVVACDELYSFSADEWAKDLADVLKPAIEAKRATREAVARAALEVFDSVVASAQNTGAMDQHRALNYALVRYPGLFLAAAERAGRQVLDRVETRMASGASGRRQVAVVLTFVDSATGVPERLFCRIDVTDEWPFVAGSPEGARGSLGMVPFVENEMLMAGY